MTGRDIFKDGPSPELQAKWEHLEDMEQRYWRAGPATRKGMLSRHPELRDLVSCEACKQELPGPPLTRKAPPSDPTLRKVPLVELAERLREMAAGPYYHTDNRNTWSRAAAAVELLARHEQQGGITMKCGHPVQCAYLRGDLGLQSGCRMCDLQKEVDSHYIGGK